MPTTSAVPTLFISCVCDALTAKDVFADCKPITSTTKELVSLEIVIELEVPAVFDPPVALTPIVESTL